MYIYIYRNIHYLLLSLLIGMAALISTAPAAAEEHLRLIHVNDFHGYAEPNVSDGEKDKVGGAAHMAARVEALRKEANGKVLLLAAGDMIQGNPWANFNEGRAVIELMKAMNFDAMVLGNHEFDYGREVLEQRIREAGFPVLAANVEGVAGIKPYAVFRTGSVRVGVLGLVTEDTPIFTHPRNVAETRFLPIRDTLDKYLPELRQHADIIILLTHIGYREDRLLAANTAGVAAIVGGHSHTKINSPPLINGTIILQAWEHGKAVGVLDMKIDKGGITSLRGRLEDIKPSGPYRTGVAAIVNAYARRQDRVMRQVIGRTSVNLDNRQIRSRETNLGNFIADIMRKDARAEAAFINSGSIRSGISAGPITNLDIYTVLPYDGYAVTMELRGREIREVLERSLACGEVEGGGFLQVSGMTLKYDPVAPSGRRLLKIDINGRPLDPERIYSVVTSDFLVAGGDGYSFPEAIFQNRVREPGNDIRTIVIDYIRGQKEICPRTEGRITSETP